MKRLILILSACTALFGQANPVQRVVYSAGTPSAGLCTSLTIGVLVAVNTTPDPDTIYDCVTVSSVATWVVRNNTAGVTSVGWTGGIVSIATATTTPAFTVAGTSGGVVYFSSSSTWASSTAPSAGQLMVWGGAGAAPTGISATTYQPLDAELTTFSGLSKARGNLLRGGASDWEVVALGASGALLCSDGTDAVWCAQVSASSAIDFGSIPDGGCLEDTMTLTGASLGNPVALGMSADLGTGLQASGAVSSSNTAKIKVCNWSGAAVNPSSITFTARVVR